nr:hypothetical protein B0A51_10288 [Rachicladosporium sp. CCFEE 5018]
MSGTWRLGDTDSCTSGVLELTAVDNSDDGPVVCTLNPPAPLVTIAPLIVAARPPTVSMCVPSSTTPVVPGTVIAVMVVYAMLMTVQPKAVTGRGLGLGSRVQPSTLAMTPPMFMLPAVVGLSVTCVAGRAVLGSFAVSASVCDIEPGPVDGVAIAFVALDDATGVLVKVDSPSETDSRLGTGDAIADVGIGVELAVGSDRPVPTGSKPWMAVIACGAVVVAA